MLLVGGGWTDAGSDKVTTQGLRDRGLKTSSKAPSQPAISLKFAASRAEQERDRTRHPVNRIWTGRFALSRVKPAFSFFGARFAPPLIRRRDSDQQGSREAQAFALVTDLSPRGFHGLDSTFDEIEKCGEDGAFFDGLRAMRDRAGVGLVLGSLRGRRDE